MADRASRTYPVRLSVEYPDGQRNRFSVFVRIILAIPIVSISTLIEGGLPLGEMDPDWNFGHTEALLVTAGLFLATALMILFRQKYPRWWFDWNLELYRFTTRVTAYLLLAAGRLSVHRRAAGRDPGHRVPGREERSQPRAAAIQVVPGHPALHRPEFSGDRGRGGDRARLVRDPDHGRTAQVDVPVPGGAHALVAPGLRLRVPADDGPLSAVPVERVGSRQCERRGREEIAVFVWCAGARGTITRGTCARRTADRYLFTSFIDVFGFRVARTLTS